MTTARFSRNRRVERLLQALVKQLGWQPTFSKHIKFHSPCGRYMLTVAISPSDHRFERNLIRDLRHKGVDVDSLERGKKCIG